MKQSIRTLAIMAMLFSASLVYAQQDKSKRASPPVQIKGKVGKVDVTIDYSSPAVNGRSVFGSLVPYGQVWRTGANEATWIELSAPLKVQGQVLAAGKYAIFTIPDKDEWTVIFNSNWNQWGSYSYKDSENVLTVKAKPAKVNNVEKFTIELGKDGTMSISWADVKVDVKLTE
jgi:hypothetical protein